MILILTDQNDIHANFLISLLEKDGFQYFRLNLDTKSLEKTKIYFSGKYWNIQTNNKRKISSHEITTVWNRKTFVQLMLDEQDKGYEFSIWKNEWNKTLLGLYYSLKNLNWINYYRNNHKAENKYYQLDVAKKIGFNIPDFIVSNNKKMLLDFSKTYPKIVMKLMNQDFYKIKNNEFKGFYVNIVSNERLAEFSENEENPIFLQKYIEKKYEVRYTVVGDKHFVCKIDSQKSEISKIDWRRYDISSTPYSIISPPKEIDFFIRKLMKELNLIYGALDFIVDEEDNWFFLEINPSGQYLWIEDLTGLKITSAIKNNLINLTLNK